MDSEHHRRETHSLPPMSRDFDERDDSTPFISVDARLVFSVAALVFALLVVAAIALIGYVAHPPNPVAHAAARPAPHDLPIVQLGHPIDTPAINLPRGMPIAIPDDGAF